MVWMAKQSFADVRSQAGAWERGATSGLNEIEQAGSSAAPNPDIETDSDPVRDS